MAHRIGELLHTDVCEQITPNEHRYFQIITYDYSHFTVVEVEENLINYIIELKATFTVNIARIKLNNEGEFRSNKFLTVCSKLVIQLEYTIIY